MMERRTRRLTTMMKRAYHRVARRVPSLNECTGTFSQYVRLILFTPVPEARLADEELLAELSAITTTTSATTTEDDVGTATKT